MVSPLFRSFVPRWFAKLILFVLLIPNLVLFFLPIANTEVAAGFFGIEPNEVLFMVTLYYAGFVSFYALERRFYSYFTYKRYFLVFQFVQLACCIVFFSTTNLFILYGIRFFQGMLFASAVNLYISMVAIKIKTFRAKEVSYSLFFGMLLCTSSFNNLITADLIDNFNFDFLFQCLILIYVVNLLLVQVFMRINLSIRTVPLVQLDISSFTSLAIFIICLGYCSCFGQQLYWFQSNTIIRVTVIGIVALALFVLRQFALKRPYVDLRILSYPRFIVGIGILFFMYICRFSIAYSGQFFTNILGMDPRHTSYMYAINLFGILLGVGIACIHLIKKRAVFILWILGFICLFLYHFMMDQQMHFYGNESSYLLPMALHGLGLGFIMVPTILYCISSVSYKLAPSAAAFCLFVRFLGYSASTILINYYTLYNATVHKSRFKEGILTTNPILQDRLLLIKTKLLQNGYNESLIERVATTLLNRELNQQVLLRSIMDYYTAMMYIAIIMICLLLLFWAYEKRIILKIRPVPPI